MRGIDDSVVYDYFLGQIMSRVVCEHCKHESIAFDEFLTLPLTFPKSSSSSYPYSYSSWSSTGVELEQLIKNFQE